MKVESSTRVVFVLGRRPTVDLHAIEMAAKSASEVVLLSLGYPVSQAQRHVVDEVLELAWRLDVPVDIALVTDEGRLAELTHSAEVHVTGSRAERRRLRRYVSSS